LRRQDPDHGADTPPDAPLAFVDKDRGALKLGAVDARAQALGLVPGLTLADARARHPELLAIPMDAEADRHWLDQLAQRCIRWSPLVSPLPPDGISIDSTGCAHLFGGEAGLIAEIEDDLVALGMTVRTAFAATAEGAQALARYATLPVSDERAAIRALPVVALGLSAEATLMLRRAGLKTVGDVAIRPAASIAARFGMAAVTALARLTGAENAPLDVLPPPAPLRFHRRFAEPLGDQTSLARVFAELLQEAADELARRGLGGRRFALTLERSDGARRQLLIETGQPTRDPALVLRLFDERIATLADPLDPGFGYDSITLGLTLAQPLAARQISMTGDSGTAEALAELVARLSTRLGAQSIQRLLPQDRHVPEQAQLALPAVHSPPPAPWPSPASGEPPTRPLFLFDPPQPVEVIAEVPDGPPHRFRWRRQLHEVRLYEGPERIAAEWWRREGGEHPGAGGLTRDYYRIEDARGRRYWLFRHGLYEEKPDPRWYLHGVFA
jgi:protein ImuB